MGIICPKCQSDNPETATFCADCGTKITSPKDIGVTKTIITPTTGLQKGSTIAGKYQILEELGRGGMGVVYKAEDTKLKRTVALKFLPPELTHIPDVKDRFMREAQAAAALDHPNICTVYEFDEAEEKTFISMAYVEGQSLRKKLESGPLELDETLRIATQVAEDLDTAEKYFDLALEKDPSYAPAYVGRAWVWIIRNQWGYSPPWEAGPKVKAAALRAIELDANYAGAHEALAMVRKAIDWDWDDAWESWRRSLELNPNVASAQGGYGLFLMMMGYGEEALIHSEWAVGLDPFNPMIHSWYAFVLYSQRRYDEAIAAAQEALRIQPDFPVAMNILWTFYEKKGMEREAFEAAKVFARVTYNDPRIEAALDEGYAQGGYAEAMKRGAEFLIALLPETFCLPTDIASFYIMAGEKDKAIEWLEKGLEIRDPALQYLGEPAFFDLLSDEPRYQELLRKIGLPVDEKE